MMASDLLQTKIRIPPTAHALVPRPRLVDLIEREIARHKLLLVSAPAGYGKTTLLSDWACSSRLVVAWLSLDDEDDDLKRFLRYLVAAWKVAQPEIKDGPLDLLAQDSSSDREALLAALINTGNQISDHLVLILDDYHVIEDPTIHEVVAFIIDHLPPTMHIVLSGRSEPPLPLARYRARQELLEFATEDLQFEATECQAFLNDLMGLELDDDELTALQERLEGWAAGLQLAALSLSRSDRSEAGSVVSGRQRYIADYLSQDVLARLPGDIQRFLVQTSILDQLSGALCDEVTRRGDSQATLELLEREGLFVSSLDDRREWFRYHRVFADYLRAELTRAYPTDVDELHRRAARWCLQNDLPEQAFRHAIDSLDVDVAIDVLERFAYPKARGGEVKLVQHWLDALPTSWQAQYPIFAIHRAILMIATGALDDCLQLLAEMDQRLVGVEPVHGIALRGRVTALRCYIACFQNDIEAAEAHAEQALTQLPEADLNFRSGIFGALGDTYRRNGRWDDAQAWYLKLLDVIDSPVVQVEAVHVFGALADLSLRQGRLREAGHHWRAALAVIEGPVTRNNVPLPLTGWVYVRMGDLLYEQNQLDESLDLVARGRQRAEVGGDVRTMIAASLVEGRLRLTQGETATTAARLAAARSLLETASFPDWSRRFDRLQVELWLATNQFPRAIRWAKERLSDGDMIGAPEEDVTQLAAARVLIFSYDRPILDRATPVLDRLVQTARKNGQMGIEIEALSLMALGHHQRGELSSALRCLTEALRLAEPEGYARLFLDLGLPMVRLLQEARTRGVAPDYVETLLQIAGAAPTPTGANETSLPEPLTEREREILHLLAAGLTNPEIAEHLFISAQTVKKHTGNIYAKLGVHSRMQAVARARELDELPE